MAVLWSWVDRAWVALASVRLTIVVLIILALLSIPGTLVMQYNISSIDPGVQYDYNFWKFGQVFQLFTAYHSFWYVGLIVILAINLIACSEQRWPQMWKLANAKPVVWARETFRRQPEEFLHNWKTPLSKDQALEAALKAIRKPWRKPIVTDDGPGMFQIFWQTGRWSRIANYLVHISLLVVFAGAIMTSLFGFEGAANIPEGNAIDTFLIFNEGKAAGLQPAQGGLINERMLGFRVECEKFDVKFYEDFPGRPSAFVSKLNIFDNGALAASGVIEVNSPLKYKNYVFYQASYGRLGDFRISLRVVDKTDPLSKQYPATLQVGQVNRVLNPIAGQHIVLVPLQATPNLQSLGPAVLFQEIRGDQPNGKPFWVLERYPQFDFRRETPYGIVLDEVRELYFTGLQVGYDPGAPIYWFGCFGMLLGTFYALFITHRKYYLRFENGQVDFSATIHRLPMGFVATVQRWAGRLRTAMKVDQKTEKKA